MASSIPPDDSPADAQTSPASAAEMLPPVEPPDARFIIQLFVVPAVIVVVVVLLWVAITWLASPGRQDAEAIVRGLRSTSQGRFQQAEELASMLRMEQSYPELKADPVLAAGLAELLVEEVEQAVATPEDDSESAIRMRMFLAASLGEMHVSEAVDALLVAIRRDPNSHVRRVAAAGVAVLAGWHAEQTPPQSLSHPELTPTLEQLADSETALDRSAAAFTLGVLSAGPARAPEHVELLAELAQDFYFDARYNAALGLARIGDLRAAPVLSEMLDLEQINASVASEQAVSPDLTGPTPPEQVVLRLQAQKRDKILKNALVGVDRLLEQTSPEDLPRVADQLQELAKVSPTVQQPGPIPETLRKAIDQMAARFE